VSYEFTLPVSGYYAPLCGFHIKRGRLFPNLGPDEGTKVKHWPDRDPAPLFLDFALSPHTPEAVLEWAHDFGDLRKSFNREGTRLTDWYSAMGELKHFSENPHRLSPRMEMELHTDPDGPAKRHRSLRLVQSYLGEVGLQAGDTCLVIAPRSLLQMLWLFAAHAAVNESEFVRCTVCSRHIQLTTKMRPDGPWYCSDTCRVQSYRDRKAAAVQMVNEGATPAEAATKLGSAVSTVMGWIGAAKKPRKRQLSLDVSDFEAERKQHSKDKTKWSIAPDGTPLETHDDETDEPKKGGKRK